MFKMGGGKFYFVGVGIYLNWWIYIYI